MLPALVLLLVLHAAIVLTIVLFRRVRSLAAMLLLACLARCLIATVLNWPFLEANPGCQPLVVSHMQRGPS